jgi:hypothetical protein
MKVVVLALITTVTASVYAVQGAHAEGGSARFSYAPNIWKVEGVRVPTIQEAPHAVKSGAVPHGPSFLGLSPHMLTKPAPVQQPVMPQAQAQTQVAARPTYTRAVPQIAVPNTQYKNEFGKAGSLTPPVVASAPTSAPPLPLPQSAGQAQSLPPMSQQAQPAKANYPAKPLVAHNRTSSSRNAHGVLSHRKTPNSLVADAGKRIDSYGNNGYVPGSFLPAAYTGDGSTTQTDVHGRVVSRKR